MNVAPMDEVAMGGARRTDSPCLNRVWWPRTGKCSVGTPPPRWTDDIKRIVGSKRCRMVWGVGWKLWQEDFVCQLKRMNDRNELNIVAQIKAIPLAHCCSTSLSDFWRERVTNISTHSISIFYTDWFDHWSSLPPSMVQAKLLQN